MLVDNLEAEVTRLRGLGAATMTPVAREEFGQRWFVLADPEGNEFCVAEDPTGDSRITSERLRDLLSSSRSQDDCGCVPISKGFPDDLDTRPKRRLAPVDLDDTTPRPGLS